MTVWPLPPGQDDVYCVAWPEHGITKVGVSGNQRWRTFLPRGAVALLVIRCRSSQALAVESAANRELFDLLPPAFTSREDAAPLLGNGGGGYCECYQDDGSVVLPVVLSYVAQLASHHELVITP